MTATEQTITYMHIADAADRYRAGDDRPARDLLKQAQGDAEMVRRILRECGVMGGPTFAPGTGSLAYEAPAGVAELRRQLEQAAEQRDRDLAALLRRDGTKLYSDTEDKQRRQQIELDYRKARAGVQRRAEQAIGLLRAAEPGEPDVDAAFDALPDAEVQRAATRLVFVQSDFNELTTEDLVARLEQVAQSSDATTRLLYLRTGRRWLARPIALTMTDPAQRAAEQSMRLAERERIRAALDAIATTFMDVDLQRILTEQAEHWQAVMVGMVGINHILDTYRPVPR